MRHALGVGAYCVGRWSNWLPELQRPALATSLQNKGGVSYNSEFAIRPKTRHAHTWKQVASIAGASLERKALLLELAAVLSLAGQCAPEVPPATLLPILQVESGFDTLALGVNRGLPPSARPTNRGEAAAAARQLLAKGGNLDLGLGQINSSNLDWLGLSIEDAFDPCKNLAAAARVLRASYRPVAGADPQSTLRIALSRYNTGDPRRGFANGYVAKVEAAARQLAPALGQEAQLQAALEPPAGAGDPLQTDVFARAPKKGLLIFAARTGAAP